MTQVAAAETSLTQEKANIEKTPKAIEALKTAVAQASAAIARKKPPWTTERNRWPQSKQK